MEYKHDIDEREIKCCCKEKNCRQTGVSFEVDENTAYLHFHYLEKEFKDIFSKRKSMLLDTKNITELITELKSIKKQIKKQKL